MPYLYNALGNKLKKTVINGQSTVVTDYVSNMIYVDNDLEMIMTEEGRMLHEQTGGGYQAEYFLKDHLGNNRVTITENNGNVVIRQEDHFYPYGMTMGELSLTGTTKNDFLYQGKEQQDEFNLYWYDFGARMFDEQLGRWHVPDPMKQYTSPYVGMGNCPSYMVDPNGMWNIGGWFRNLFGSFGWANGTPQNNNYYDNKYWDDMEAHAYVNGGRLSAEDLCEIYSGSSSESSGGGGGGGGGSDFGDDDWMGYSGPGYYDYIWSRGGEEGSMYIDSFYDYLFNFSQYLLGFSIKPVIDPNAGFDPNLVFIDQTANIGDDLSLATLYSHFQFGGGKSLNINMSSVDFGGATQKDLGLVGMDAGDVRAVQLFQLNSLTTAGLAFGRVNMMAHGNNQFSIVSDNSARFDFAPLIDWDASLQRNVGNVIGASINYNLFFIHITPLAPVVPLIFGGPFDVNFYGTTTIPK